LSNLPSSDPASRAHAAAFTKRHSSSKTWRGQK
jgi:hypothetical protein